MQLLRRTSRCPPDETGPETLLVPSPLRGRVATKVASQARKSILPPQKVRTAPDDSEARDYTRRLSR